jgi:GntR family transcriptional regulator, transcriptional repressor for pyruvate dehydrogenase complex
MSSSWDASTAREARTFEPVTARRTFESVVEQLAYAIRLGELTVGTRLPPERELAAAMEISRPTLREAIKVLARAQLVRVEPGAAGGTVVASDSVPADLLTRQIRISVAEVGAVLEARRAFEPTVAQLAGLYATTTDFRRLREIIEDHRRAITNRDRYNQCDEQFHSAIASATGNPVIVEVMRGFLRRVAIARDMDQRRPLDPEGDLRMHEWTLEALMSRRPEQIAEIMDKHLSILEEEWADELGRARPLAMLLDPSKQTVRSPRQEGADIRPLKPRTPKGDN